MPNARRGIAALSQKIKNRRKHEACDVLVDPKGIEPSNLTDANRALSQLSYGPKFNFPLPYLWQLVHYNTNF